MRLRAGRSESPLDRYALATLRTVSRLQPLHTPCTCDSHRLKPVLGQQHSLEETTANRNVMYLEKSLMMVGRGKQNMQLLTVESGCIGQCQECKQNRKCQHFCRFLTNARFEWSENCLLSKSSLEKAEKTQ